jgi:Ca2+-binding EF-hand superfamily protein
MMSRKKAVLLTVSALTMAGAVAAVSAPGRRDDGAGAFQNGPGLEEPMMRGGRGFMGHRMGHKGERMRPPMTKSEFEARTRERFARLDRNSDGVIDMSEIEAALSERMAARRGAHGGQAGHRLTRMFDLDHDGKVTKAEFLDSVKKRFAQFDLNNDGRLTDDDLPPMMRGRNILTKASAGTVGHRLAWLRDVDVDAQGAITQEAVLASAEKRFATFDRNNDGVIDTADLDALRKDNLDYRVKRFVHYFGADKDGKITREQFTAKANERFARLDRNADGTISRHERLGHHGWRGEFRRGGHGPHGPDGETPASQPAPENEKK